MRESRETRQDRALVLLLQALPEDRLYLVLTELGVTAERIAEATRAKDKRRCAVCGNGYVRCREIDTKANDHEWTPA